MIRAQTLLQAPLVTVARVDHAAGVEHVDPPEEVACGYELNFVERGAFDVRAEGRSHRFSPGNIFVTWPGLTFRCRHEHSVPQDVCLSVSVSPDMVVQRFDGRRCPPVFLPASNRMGYLHWRFSTGLLQHNGLAADELALDLIDAVAAQGASAPKTCGPQQLRWYAPRVERARCLLESQFPEHHSLRALAAEAGMSIFHFARVFRELTGAPPHRYLLRRGLLQPQPFHPQLPPAFWCLALALEPDLISSVLFNFARKCKHFCATAINNSR